MLSDFGVVFLFFILAIGFIFVTLLFGKLIRPNKPSYEKLTTYECGELPVGSAWINFNIRFYIIALVFLLFDVEIVFILPLAVVYRDWIANNMGLFALIELTVFIGILVFALIYALGKGDVDWVKTMSRTEEVHEK